MSDGFHLGRSLRLKITHLVLLLCALLTMAGCLSTSGQSIPVPVGNTKPASDFESHRQDALRRLRTERHFQTPDTDNEVSWNAPFEIRPETATKKALLLVHGLGDSPWSFVDIASDLAAQGYVVRTLLLDGHGTQPADLIETRLEAWQQVVHDQVAVLHKEFPDVYLGGFSTGANLVLAHAMDDPGIRGLLLFSPALRARTPYDWLAPWWAKVRTWVFPPDSSPQQSALRYYNVPANGFAQFYRSSVAVRARLHGRTFDRPVAVVLAEHDSVVDVEFVRQVFERQFTHADSRLIWYGQPGGPVAAPGTRTLTRPDHIPSERISQFSHMGLLFSPGNPLYGRQGTQTICANGQAPAEEARCAAGEQVWFADWGYREPGKVHARLTFNPYFHWQQDVVRGVLRAGEHWAPPPP